MIMILKKQNALNEEIWSSHCHSGGYRLGVNGTIDFYGRRFPTKTIVGESDIDKSKFKFKDDDAEGPATTVSGDLDGKTFVPGVYKSPTSVATTGTVILDGHGNPNSVFIVETGSTFTTAPRSQIQLVDGAQSGNIFRVFGRPVTLGADSSFRGTILATSGITANKRAHVD